MTTPLRVLAVAALAVLPAIAQPQVAAADRPPAVDNTLLPPAAPPHPPEPTERKYDCTSALFDAAVKPRATQLSSIDLPALWALTTGQGQKVAVIDTGVSTHPGLPRLIPGGDYVSTGNGVEDCDGHGTMVAGIIAAAPDSGASEQFAGIAPGVSLITIRQSSAKYRTLHGRDSGIGDVDTLAMAVRTAADMGATVINISSVACTADTALHDRALGAAVAYAVDEKDVVVVVAAGNVGPGGTCPQQNPPPDRSRIHEPDWETADVAVSPGWYDEYVLTVASIGATGSASSFSLAGPWVDVAAPGEDVVSLNPDGRGLANTNRAGGSPLAGTSYAAPVVSGLAALVRARFPSLSAREVMARIEATAHRPPGGWNPFVGNGPVDPLAALSDDSPSSSASAPWPHRQVAPPAAPSQPDRSGRTTAFLGVGGCAAVLAAALALVAPASRLARLRRRGDGSQPDSARVGGHPIVGD